MHDGKRIRVVALVAREPGLTTLRGLSVSPGPWEVCAIYTHRREPRSVDPARGERPQYPRYVELARAWGIPLHTVDSRAEAEKLEGLEAHRPFDVLLSVSWWYLVSQRVLDWPRLAPINVHRGRLPTYAGLKPVQRALQAGETTVTLTAHLMTAECDAGPVLVERTHPVGSLQGPALLDDVERVKRELWPLYPQVAAEAIEQVAGPLSFAV